MAFEQRDNSGSIFKNDRKEKESHPDGKGSAMIDGVEYWISSWNKTSSSGKQFRSLSFQRKESQEASQQRQQAEPRSQDKAGQWKAGTQQRSAPQRMTYGGASDKSEGYADDGMESDIPF